MSRVQRGFCYEEDIQNIITKLEELEKIEEGIITLEDDTLSLSNQSYLNKKLEIADLYIVFSNLALQAKKVKTIAKVNFKPQKNIVIPFIFDNGFIDNNNRSKCW